MRQYDPAKPLIFIHIPKTAGTSVRQVFQNWYPNFSEHYFSKKRGSPPPLVDVHASPPPTIYGHFNRSRGFGIDQRYPTVSQFVAILRDPLDQHISSYFYARANYQIMAVKGPPPDDPELYVTTQRMGMLRHFPSEVTWDNYREMIESDFVEVGIFEDLPGSLARIARKLDKPFKPDQLPRLNVTPRTAQISDEAIRIFREKNALEYAVYNYVAEKYGRAAKAS